MKARENDVYKLLQIIGSPCIEKQFQEPVESQDLFEAAYRNRVVLLYLRKLHQAAKLEKLQIQYERNLARHNQLHQDVRRLIPALDRIGLSYALLKTLRYYPENPNDIDILVFDELEPKLGELVGELEKLGYRKYDKGNNRYNFGRIGKVGFSDYKRSHSKLEREDEIAFFDLDFYGEIMVEELVHGDKSMFVQDAVAETFANVSDLSDTTARVLSPSADLFYVYFHSIFPTRYLGLEVFYTTLFNLKRFREEDYTRFAELCRRSRLKSEVTYAVKIAAALYQFAYGVHCDLIEKLLDRVQGRKVAKLQIGEVDFPFSFPLMLFLLAGFKSSLHKKGYQSMLAVLIKCISPFYAWNILRGTFCRKLARFRYGLHYDNLLK